MIVTHFFTKLKYRVWRLTYLWGEDKEEEALTGELEITFRT
jgi:hypothetical protein